MKYHFLTVFLFLFFSFVSLAQTEKDDLRLYDRFMPVKENNIFKTEGYYNWGSSIIKGKDGKYHLFYSRWKKEYTFAGWLTHSEIAHAVAVNPAGPWKYKDTALKGRGKGHWDAITAHNPKVKYFDGKYYLYYIATNMGDKEYTEQDLIATHGKDLADKNRRMLREHQRTGVAVSHSINGPWERKNQSLIEPAGPITTLTVNPAIDKGKDGKYYLIIKGDKPNEKRFIRNQAIAISDSPIGPFKIQEKAVIDDLDTEDVSMWYDTERKRFYAVFHAHDFIGMIISENGIDWKKSNEYVLLPKSIKKEDGVELKPDRMERPFIYREDGKPKVLSLAVKKGEESYTVFVPIKEEPKYPLPNKRQLAWQEAELGVVFHYDLHVFDGKKYGQGNNRIDPVGDYQIFNPEKLDTDQWIKAAKDAGAKFALLTATHETGFALFQSNVNPYSLKSVKWRDGKGDIVADFVASCRKYGIKPGIYLGIRWNSFLGVHDFKVSGTGKFKENRQLWYKKMTEGMVKEICTKYGDLFEIWFDGGADHPKNGAPDVLPIVRRYQPNCLFYHNGQLAEARWGGSESGTVNYPSWATFPYKATGAGESAKKNIAKDGFKLLKEGDPNGKFWMPAMSDAPLRGYNGRHEWFWEPDDEAHIFPVKDLVDMYYKSVGRNSTLILGLTPDNKGLLPEADVKRLKEFGDNIRNRFAAPIAVEKGNGNQISLNLPKETKINHLVIQEEISKGERVRQYSVEALINGKWKEIATGESIGHKRIQKIAPIKTNQIRLKINASTQEAQIKAFSAYWVEEILAASNYHHTRSGLQNSYIKFEREKKGRVAFLGGSITYNTGWRDSIAAYLVKRFPETEFEFIAAGIPSMGTTPAAFRLKRDVLSQGAVDLLFEEAAVNDSSNGRTSTEQIRAMEGIIRQTRKSNPASDIIMLHFVDPDKMEKYNNSIEPEVITNHNQVATHYNLPTINLAKEVTDRIKNKEFTWEEDFKNLHPSPFGQGIYAHSIITFLSKAYGGHLDNEEKIVAHPLEKKLAEYSYDAGDLVAIDKANLSEGWRIDPKWNPNDGTNTRANYVNVPMLVSTKSAGNLKLTFKGSTVGIAVAAGPDAGIIEYRIDGNNWHQLDLFTKWSSQLHLPWYYTLSGELEEKEHVLEIRMSKTKNAQREGHVCRIRYFFVNDK